MRDTDALWLFGSAARGDADYASDVDLLFVTDNLNDLAPTLSTLKFSKPKLARYTWNDVKHMASYGSLFLDHVKRDGRKVFESHQVRGRLERILAAISRYRYSNRDLVSFGKAISDIEEALQAGSAIHFEMSNLAIVLRHLCIVGCYEMGNPCYGRYESVYRCCDDLGLDISVRRDLVRIYSFRLFADGRAPEPNLPDADLVSNWIFDANHLLRRVKEEIDDQSRSMHRDAYLGA